MRVGIGYDAHKLVKGRKLILGGVDVPYKKGLLGHSDADVLAHAIIDAIIGAMAAGSIGEFFPDTDPRYKDVSSLKLLSMIAEVALGKDLIINNVDSVIVCQDPKLLPYMAQMRDNIAKTLGLDNSRVNVKAKTEEGMGFTGKKEGISAYAVALIHKKV